jgi:nitrosocyanin
VKRSLSISLLALALVTAACGRPSEHAKVTIATINGQLGFSVATLTFTKGQTIDLRIDNDTDAAHGFSIDAYGIHEVVEPHRPVTVRLKADKVGDFAIYSQRSGPSQESHLLVVE